MTIANPAAQAIIEALKDPALGDGQRMALVAALQAVMAASGADCAAAARAIQRTRSAAW